MKRSSHSGEPHEAVWAAETLLGTAKPARPGSWSHCCGRKETERTRESKARLRCLLPTQSRPWSLAHRRAGSSNLPVFEELMAMIVSCSQQMKGREQAPLAL